ncbi:hypothetical protein LOZ53_004388 [Ophidiomyces ophidiicola]|nr:hypothetical protein LOZ55_004635 [Ophidiomyces ophidiicola]KAI1984680.1 hypothetical protein LOZ51_006577 [Ophidiomyces ophidiicola]KAI1987332.1 hypothetical protein LOZ53_004388 [Ophidiomyces ophidiicola]KAI1993138.1 hypothetical protein LOZ54_001487 [Ophidiomyces ophidiicola]
MTEILRIQGYSLFSLPWSVQFIAFVIVALSLRYIRSIWFQSSNSFPPRVHTWLPLSLDYIARSIIYNYKHQNLLLWEELFVKHHPSETLEVKIGSKSIIISRDPENVKAILATQFAEYGKGENFHREWKPFLGDAIFTTDGDQWHSSRALIRPMFARDRVSDLSTFERHTLKLITILSSPKLEGKPVDVHNLFLRLTMDIATDFLLGSSVNSLDNPTNKFTEAFATVQQIQSWITMAGPFQTFIPKEAYNQGLQTINSFVEPFITKTLALLPEELEAASSKETNFLTALATFTRDPKMIRDQLVSVLLAARDTTAASLSWVIYELSAQPGMVQRLRREILSTVGPASQPSHTDLKSMRYLQAVLKETLRLYPAIPYNMRLALKDTTLPRGGGPRGELPISIKKDTLIAYSPLSMQRQMGLYPETYPDKRPFPDPSKFEPERWIYNGRDNGASTAALPEGVDCKTGQWIPKPWTYIPFNGGPRICIGQQFALAEMAYTLVKIFQKYSRVERQMEEKECGVLRANIVLTPAHGVRVVLLEDSP